MARDRTNRTMADANSVGGGNTIPTHSRDDHHEQRFDTATGVALDSGLSVLPPAPATFYDGEKSTVIGIDAGVVEDSGLLGGNANIFFLREIYLFQLHLHR